MRIKNFISIILISGLFRPLILDAQIPVNPYIAPLYWSVYENHIMKEKAGVSNNYISEEEFLTNINWIDINLKDFGYKMICLDGWGDVNKLSENGYRSSHSSQWKHDFSWWSDTLQQMGLSLGMYANPLWIHVSNSDTETLIKGTSIPVSTLKDPSEISNFPWCQVDHPGAEEYVKGYIRYYADMGIKYLRVDFLSWFENGQDRYLGKVGPDRPHEHYETALRWMREECDANGMFLSLVMPHLFNDAGTEIKYGHMIRINEDCGDGDWYRFSDMDRGLHREGWSQYANTFDGYTYWSKIAGRGKMILDGDFIRLNAYNNVEERKSVFSLHLMAGGPVSITDQWNTIGSNLWIYQNEELLELNSDGFVGSPLSTDPTNDLSQIWTGQMKNEDWIVGFFNRETSLKTRTINFQETLGISEAYVRDLWAHTDLGVMSSLSRNISSRRCMIFRISSQVNKVIAPVYSIKGGSFPEAQTVSMSTSTAGADIYYTIDGSQPTQESILYATPVGIATSCTVKAAAFKDGMDSSYVSKEIYFIGESPSQGGMYVGGTFNSWILPDLPMNYSGGNDWTTHSVYITAGLHELKFANQNNWKGADWGNANGLTGTAKLTTGGGANIRFTAPVSGDYIISFNDYTLQYSILKTFNAVHSKMYLGGSMNDWGLSSNVMKLSSDYTWECDSVELSSGNHSLKFANTPDWSGIDWGRASGLSGTAKVSTGGLPGISFTITQSGLYNIYFNDITLAYSIQSLITDIQSDVPSGVSVYPNPSKEILVVDVGREISAQISIISLTGNILCFEERYGSKFEIMIRNYGLKGLFFLKVSTDSGSKVFKLIAN